MKNYLFITVIIFFNFHIFSKSLEQDISFFKVKQKNLEQPTQESWAFEFFKQRKKPILTGKNTKIVILDIKITNSLTNCHSNYRTQTNLSTEERNNDFLTMNQKNKNLATERVKKNDNLSKFRKKTHGDITRAIIKLVAPDSDIILIPILDDYGYATKEEILKGLNLALQHKPDILHLSFQILDFDRSQKIDQKIYKLLQRFKCIIVPAGNHIDSANFPSKKNNVFSVASFGKMGEKYPISFFSKSSKADFIMPGENIIVPLWDKEEQKIIAFQESGTSISAAFMTGTLAQLFEKNKYIYSQNRSKIRQDLIKHSQFLDNSWKARIRYGFPYF